MAVVGAATAAEHIDVREAAEQFGIVLAKLVGRILGSKAERAFTSRSPLAARPTLSLARPLFARQSSNTCF